MAGMILLIGALFVGARFLGASDKLVPATIVYRLPEGTVRIESEARPAGKDELLARFVANDLGARTEARQLTHLPPGTIDLSIILTAAPGESTQHRTVEISRDAVVTVDLTR
jgi:hypothetical protein